MFTVTTDADLSTLNMFSLLHHHCRTPKLRHLSEKINVQQFLCLQNDPNYSKTWPCFPDNNNVATLSGGSPGNNNSKKKNDGIERYSVFPPSR